MIANSAPGHQHVVEVGDHEIGVVVLEVGRHDRQHQAGEAADREQEDEAEREQHRRLEGHRALRHIVATQLNTFTPVGTAISMVAYMKNSWPPSGMPTVNMWCAQTMNDRKAIEAVAYTIAW
jgi:hypothetical protein